MENNKERGFKEERFEFTIYVNDNIICKRNFRIFNYIEHSMNTYEFNEKLDEIVNLINEDLKSKSRVYTWYYFNPQAPEDNEEMISPLIEPWACTFKIVITDNKKHVITRIWDGYAYPKFIRDKVDLGNKNVKVVDKDGRTRIYDKETFFKSNEDRLSFEYEVLKGMIMDKQDVLSQITRKICEACSPSVDSISEKGYFDPKENYKYLSKYTVIDNYGKDANGKDKEYSYSLYLANKKYEKDWERAVASKTSKYFKNLF